MKRARKREKKHSTEKGENRRRRKKLGNEFLKIKSSKIVKYLKKEN
jgi:hypothetical protein